MVLGTEPSPVQPQLARAVMQVLDMDAADVISCDHTITPRLYWPPVGPLIARRP